MVWACLDGAPDIMAALPHSHGETLTPILLSAERDSGLAAAGTKLLVAGTNADADAASRATKESMCTMVDSRSAFSRHTLKKRLRGEIS